MVRRKLYDRLLVVSHGAFNRNEAWICYILFILLCSYLQFESK